MIDDKNDGVKADVIGTARRASAVPQKCAGFLVSTVQANSDIKPAKAFIHMKGELSRNADVENMDMPSKNTLRRKVSWWETVQKRREKANLTG